MGREKDWEVEKARVDEVGWEGGSEGGREDKDEVERA